MSEHNDIQELVRRFNNAAILDKSIVRARVTDSEIGTPTFQIYYAVDDILIENRNYDEGFAIIYPSKQVYTRLDVIAGDLDGSIEWNNTYSIGWLK